MSPAVPVPPKYSWRRRVNSVSVSPQHATTTHGPSTAYGTMWLHTSRVVREYWVCHLTILNRVWLGYHISFIEHTLFELDSQSNGSNRILKDHVYSLDISTCISHSPQVPELSVNLAAHVIVSKIIGSYKYQTFRHMWPYISTARMNGIDL